MRFTFNVITVDHHKIFKVLRDYFLKMRLLNYDSPVKDRIVKKKTRPRFEVTLNLNLSRTLKRVTWLAN